jgi:hypothetical protein
MSFRDWVSSGLWHSHARSCVVIAADQPFTQGAFDGNTHIVKYGMLISLFSDFRPQANASPPGPRKNNQYVASEWMRLLINGRLILHHHEKRLSK